MSNSFKLHAQLNPEPFNTITIGFNYSENVIENNFHNHWYVEPAFEGYLSTPFYLGNIQTGVRYNYFPIKDANLPYFYGLFYYLQWENEFSLASFLSFSVGGRAGLYSMNFDENEIIVDRHLLNESELAIGAVSKLSANIYAGWAVHVTADYNTIFTSEKINLFFIGAGISKTFHSPSWLKDFLK